MMGIYDYVEITSFMPYFYMIFASMSMYDST